MFHRSIVQLAVFVLLLLPAVGAAACEYCVREVGFVALYNEPYRVVVAVGPETSDRERDRVLAQMRAELGPGNVLVSVGSPEEGGLFADAAEQAAGVLPAVVVHAPDGRNRPIYILMPDRDSPMDGVARSIGGLTHSTAREGLAEALIDGYATVLLVEGADDDANAAARELAEQAIQRINAVKSGFDRVIEIGPALRVITAEERQREGWLLWSLGIESMGVLDPEAIVMPCVAVLYGKGRRLGDVLTGNTLTDNALFTMLSYVARDCECDLDRGWLYGTTIPLVWDDALRRRAYDSLGFDPESAATRAAVSRIIERGPGSSGTNARDPFLEDGGTNIGIPGLTIHNLDDPVTTVPPAVAGGGQGVELRGDGTPRFPSLDDQPVPDSRLANATVETHGPSLVKTVSIVLGVFGFVVLVCGGILASKSRGNH